MVDNCTATGYKLDDFVGAEFYYSHAFSFLHLTQTAWIHKLTLLEKKQNTDRQTQIHLTHGKTKSKAIKFG